MWNLYAKVYDVINENVPYLKMLSEVIDLLDLKDGLSVLDAGCGTGNLSYRISSLHTGLRITAIDSSREMLACTKKKLESINNVEVDNMNFENKLNFQDDAFDRIVTVNALYTLTNQKQCLGEFHRLLKKDGKLVIANPDDQYRFSSIFKAQLKELGWLRFIYKFLVNLPALLVIIYVNLFYIKKDKFTFLGQNEIEGLLKEVGFNVVKIQRTYANQDLLIMAEK